MPMPSSSKTYAEGPRPTYAAKLRLAGLVTTSPSNRPNDQAERRSRFEIDRGFVSRRCLHRQVGRLLALEDAIDVTGRLPALFNGVYAIRHQAAVGDEEAKSVDRRKPMPGR